MQTMSMLQSWDCKGTILSINSTPVVKQNRFHFKYQCVISLLLDRNQNQIHHCSPARGHFLKISYTTLRTATRCRRCALGLQTVASYRQASTWAWCQQDKKMVWLDSSSYSTRLMLYNRFLRMKAMDTASASHGSISFSLNSVGK